MKIDVTKIFADHIGTLKNADTDRRSYIDIGVFYAFPLIPSAAVFSCVDFRDDVYNAGLTFFGIFIGLLINVQVALFSILQRGWTSPKDEKSKSLLEDKIKTRSQLLEQSNSNISYLILISCFAAVICVVFYVTGGKTGFGPAIVTYTSTHFALTLLMVTKRLHALFQIEYSK